MITLKNLLIGLSLVAFFFMAFNSWISEGSETYGITIDGNFSEINALINTTMTNQSKIAGDLEAFAGNITEGTFVGVAGALRTGASAIVGIVKMPFISLIDFHEIITKLAIVLEIPGYVIFIFETLIAIIIIMIMLSLVLKMRDV